MGIVKAKFKEWYIWVDYLGLVLSLIFMESVAGNVSDQLQTGMVNAPNTFSGIIVGLIMLYRVFKLKKLSAVNYVSIGILISSGFIWLVGLH